VEKGKKEGRKNRQTTDRNAPTENKGRNVLLAIYFQSSMSFSYF
jgi:hypothetical protein